MLLSTSNSKLSSEQRRSLSAVWALLATVGMFLVAGEIGIHVAYRKWSAIEGRIASEYRQVAAIRRARGEAPVILFLGNSLLLEALDVPGLRDRLAPRAQVARFAVEGTGFQDWHYGIRRLLAQGSRPDVIVLCMSAAGMLTPDIRGDYSSYYLFDLADIPAISRELRFDLTRTSSLLFAHFSLFYAARNNYRVFVMNRIDLPYSRIAQALGPHQSGTLPSGEVLVQAIESRMRVLRQDAAPSGLRVMLLVPPGSLPCDNELIQAGLRTGVDTMIPFRADTMPRNMFRDATHLNRDGSALFTAAVETELRARVLR
jgi:hypothetical protein